MNNEKFIKELTKEENFVAATKVIHRVEAVNEVEDLTAYPFPSHEKAKRADDYFLRTEKDQKIQDRKKEIAKQAMSEFWAADVQTLAGIQDLANKTPDAKIEFSANWEFGVKVTCEGNTVNLTPSKRLESMRVGEFAKAVTLHAEPGIIKYTIDGKPGKVTKVVMVRTENVLIYLE